ncbi:hypothetical protein HJB86_21375 [Rhizobium sp. NZLR3b]|uniref:hypothetical protein n=1 Tax=Rhizobium sp. NZLR3b TaxID=2731101 RepID=UPI001C83F69D|nr:hypothetical protein [Rhizobium sp. NZLR3b]MBX5191435.1 hypothetical protein [Rhizobium sp. NZLR3b]
MKSTETTPQVITAEADAELMGKVVLPILIVLIFAGYQLLIGERETKLEMTLLAAGSIASMVAAAVYRSLGRKANVSWRYASAAFLGLIPYGFGICVIIALGVWPMVGLWHAGFAIWPILAGCFWTLVGWRIVVNFWVVTELVAAESRA